jgi:hypothetical protein
MIHQSETVEHNHIYGEKSGVDDHTYLHYPRHYAYRDVPEMRGGARDGALTFYSVLQKSVAKSRPLENSIYPPIPTNPPIALRCVDCALTVLTVWIGPSAEGCLVGSA